VPVVSVRVPEPVYRELRRRAEEQGKSLYQYVRELLEAHVAAEEREEQSLRQLVETLADRLEALAHRVEELEQLTTSHSREIAALRRQLAELHEEPKPKHHKQP